MSYNLPVNDISINSSGELVFNASVAGTPLYNALTVTNALSAGSLVLTVSPLPVTSGGTGTTTSTGTGNVVLSTSPTLATPVLGIPASVTLTNATGLPLTSGVTGVLPIANGGTNNLTSYTSGSIIFSNGTSLTQDNSEFFWDDTTHRLGIGTAVPAVSLEVNGAVQIDSASTTALDLSNGGGITLTATTPTNGGSINLTGTGTNGLINLSNVIDWTATVAPALSSSGHGRIYFDSTSNTFQQSSNGGTYAPLGAVTSITGTANQIIASASTGAITLSTPQSIATTSSPTFSDLTLSSLVANSFVYSGTSGLLSTTAAPTNGQLLIGSTGTAPVSALLTGTTNEILVTNGAGSITLSTPQAIATTSSPTFQQLTLGSTTPGGLVLNDTEATPKTVTVEAPTTLTSTYTLKLPVTAGTIAYFLQTDGFGNTSWVQGGGVGYREDYVVGTALNNYTGSTTVFNLVNAYNVGGHTLIVTLDGDVQTIGSTIDYVETNSTTVTFNNALVTGQKVSFIFSQAPSSVSGNINSGLTNQLAYYATGGTTLSGLSGPLPVTSGGTGTTTSTGTGNVVLSTSPTLTTPALGTPSAAVLTNATGLPLTSGVTGVLPIANGGTNSGTTLNNGHLMYSNSGAIVENTNVAIVSTGAVTFPVTVQSVGFGRLGVANQAYAEFGLSSGSAILQCYNPGANTYGPVLVQGSSVSLTSGTGTNYGVFQSAASGGTQLLGTIAGDNAASGIVGEFVSSSISAANFPTSSNYGDFASITLTPGDWDIFLVYNMTPNGATMTNFAVGINTLSGNQSAGLVLGQNFLSQAVTSGSTQNWSGSLAFYRANLTSTTTFYFKGIASYSGVTPLMYGIIEARRRR